MVCIVFHGPEVKSAYEHFHFILSDLIGQTIIKIRLQNPVTTQMIYIELKF